MLIYENFCPWNIAAIKYTGVLYSYMCVYVNTGSPNDDGGGAIKGEIIGGIVGLTFISALITIIII